MTAVADSTRKAVLTVAAHARDAAECRELLAMLGITPPARKRKPGRPEVNHGHGDHRTYAKGCHCARCRAANVERCRRQQERRISDPEAADRAGHGNASTYQNYACRCRPCTEANSVKSAAYKAQRRERAALAELGGVS